MRSITIQNLKKLVSEEKSSEILKEEIIKVLGPTINYSPKLEKMVEEANDRLEVLERTGRASRIDFKPSTLLKFSKHDNPEVRKFVAKTLPNTMLERFMYDSSPEVRHAAAKRIPLNKLKEMAAYYKHDDELREIKKVRLIEASKNLQEPRYGEKMLGKAKQYEGPDLTDTWYSTEADRAISTLNGNIEGQWQRPYVDQLHMASAYKFDADKLYNMIMLKLNQKDDEALVQDKLKNAAKRVFEGAYLREAFMEDEKSIFSEVISRRTSNTQRINLCRNIFSIKEERLSPSFSKMRLNEGLNSNVTIPTSGILPRGHGFTYEVEQALDAYSDSWNMLSEASGDNLRISWAPDPASMRKFLFVLETK